MAQFAKAESLLKRVDDLIASDDKRSALQELQQMVQNRKYVHRQWTDTVDQIMKKYVEVCVELRKPQDVKTILQTCRTICQQSNTMKALDIILEKYLNLSEEKLTSAFSKASKPNVDLGEDSDMWPENVLLSAMADDFQDRADRELVMPWLRAVWDAYRNVLDLLKNNALLEGRYHHTAKRAFDYCKRYKRRSEFKNLTMMLRNHLQNIIKYSPQDNKEEGDAPTNDGRNFRVNLNAPATIKQYIDTRGEQLSTAVDLELWQEAYKSVEDIHGLLEIAKKPQELSWQVQFADKLAKIFWVGRHYLLHAFSLHKVFSIAKNNAKLVGSDRLKQVASGLFVASLCIPDDRKPEDNVFGDHTNSEILDYEKQTRMTALLGAAAPPSKNQILAEVVNSDAIAQNVYPEIANLHNIFQEYDPLNLTSSLAPIFQFMSGNSLLQQYVAPLTSMLVGKVLQQLSQAYSVIKIEEVLKLCPKEVTADSLERELVQSVQEHQLLLTVDHQNGVIYFGKGNQTFDNATIRNEIKLFAKRIHAVHNVLNKEERAKQRKERLQAIASLLQTQCEAEHTENLKRKDLIEKKKQWEDLEKAKQALLQDEKAKQAELQRQEEEKKRQDDEKKLREEMRKKREEQVNQQNAARLLVQQLAEKQNIDANVLEAKIAQSQAIKTKRGKKPQEGIVDQQVVIQNVEMIMEAQKEQFEKEQKEKERKLIELARHLDYLERAKREEELKLIEQEYEKVKVVDNSVHEEQEKRNAEEHEKRLEQHRRERERFSRMFQDKEAFVRDQVMQPRVAEYTKLKQEQDKRKEEKRIAFEERKKYIQFIIEFNKKKKEEDDKKKKEEDEKKKKEEDAKRKQQQEEYAAQKAKADAQIKKQMEIEEQMRQKRLAAQKPQPKTTGSRWDNMGSDTSSNKPSPQGTGSKYVPPSQRGAQGGFKDDTPAWSKKPVSAPPQQQAATTTTTTTTTPKPVTPVTQPKPADTGKPESRGGLFGAKKPDSAPITKTPVPKPQEGDDDDDGGFTTVQNKQPRSNPSNRGSNNNRGGRGFSGRR